MNENPLNIASATTSTTPLARARLACGGTAMSDGAPSGSGNVEGAVMLLADIRRSEARLLAVFKALNEAKLSLARFLIETARSQ